MTRTFQDKPATREAVPLLIGLVGPSGGGKTYSALRLSTGIQRVVGGEIYMVDTEQRRGLHYADRFNYRHVVFDAPFGPLDYLAALEHCVARGAKTIIVDSFSHEHEGPGGVLEMHTAELDRMMANAQKKGWNANRDKYNFPAWKKPKAERRRLLNSMLQLNANFVLCFRAKEKAKPAGKELVDMGWMPIGGEEHLYEMTARALLKPNADGVPTWRAERPGEKLVYKLPLQFRDMFREGAALCEEHGEKMARWAAGDGKPKAAAVPRFGKKLAWSGKDAWAGKPLADAPGSALVAYGMALEAATTTAKGKAKQAIAAHMATVSEALAAKTMASAGAELDAEAAAHDATMAKP